MWLSWQTGPKCFLLSGEDGAGCSWSLGQMLAASCSMCALSLAFALYRSCRALWWQDYLPKWAPMWVGCASKSRRSRLECSEREVVARGAEGGTSGGDVHTKTLADMKQTACFCSGTAQSASLSGRLERQWVQLRLPHVTMSSACKLRMKLGEAAWWDFRPISYKSLWKREGETSLPNKATVCNLYPSLSGGQHLSCQSLATFCH